MAVRTPKEDALTPSGYAILLKAMYGLMDAGACFDAKVEGVMTRLGYIVGLYSPCLYYHPVTGVKVLRHGDDFAVAGTRKQIKDFHEAVGKELILKHIATLGPSPAMGDSQEVRCLNRLIRWVRPPFGRARSASSMSQTAGMSRFSCRT